VTTYAERLTKIGRVVAVEWTTIVILKQSCSAIFVLSFVMRGLIADVITTPNFLFRGFGVLTPRNFAISIGSAGRSYNSVYAALPCYSVINISLKSRPTVGAYAILGITLSMGGTK